MLDVLLPIILVVMVLFLCMHLAVSYDVAKAEPIINQVGTADGIKTRDKFNTRLFLDDVADRLGNHPDELVFVKSTPKFLLGGAFVCFILLAYYITTRRKLINGKEYGTARWASKNEIEHLSAMNLCKKEIGKVSHNLNKQQRGGTISKIKAKYEDADMIFTDTERICMYNYELNNNTLIIGGSGSGKTRGFVMPNILQAHSSYVVTDPKGEILEKAGHFLEAQKGYKLRILNLDEKELSDSYNPFHYIHRERAGWEERVLSLIETIIINTDGGEKKGGSDPFWDKAERLFLQAIFFATIESFPPEEANMNTVMELIGLLSIEEERDNFDSDLDIFFEIFKDNYGDTHIGYQQFKEFRQKAGGKTAKSIVISAVARLAPFKVNEVRRIFSTDEMHLERVGEEKTAVFVIVPPTDTTYNFIAGMLFTQLFQELNYCALNVHKHDGKRLPVPCRFILDEFANTCTIPNFVSILAYARSLGIGIVTILQSLEQIKKMYKDDWGVIVDNSNTLLYLGKVTHMDTLKYLSELLGKGTFDKETSSRSRGGQGSSSISRDRLGRELLDPSEIRKIKNNKCLLFVGGLNPFYSRKYDYKNHKNYCFTSDDDKEFSYVSKRSPVENAEVDNQKRYTTIKAIVPPKVYTPEETAEYISANLLSLDFESGDLLLVNDGEMEELDIFEGYPFEDTSPHGEEKSSKKRGVIFEEKEMVDFLSSNFFSSDFKSDDSFVVRDKELEDLVILQGLLKEPKTEQDVASVISAAKAVVNMAENLKDYDYRNMAINDGESTEQDEESDVYELDEDTEEMASRFEQLKNEAMLMKEDIIVLSKLLDSDSQDR